LKPFANIVVFVSGNKRKLFLLLFFKLKEHLLLSFL